MRRVQQPNLLALLRGFRWMLAAALVLVSALPAVAAAPGAVLQIEMHDTLQPERAEVFARALDRANEQGYSAVVLNLSTPGGLSASADRMVEAMQRSRIPVIAWVGSPQTRVSGEGLRLLFAADLALMNPRAFLTPLWTDRVHGYTPLMRAAESQRLLQNLIALHAQHGRNPDNLEELTAGSHWFTAGEAADDHLIDGVAEKMPDVLRVASGKVKRRDGAALSFPASGVTVDDARLELQELLLVTLMNPDLCVLLLTLGMLLIYLEINTPGAVVPGAAGVLLVLLAVYALHLLPLNVVGVLLCSASSLLLLLEGRSPRHGVLAALGVLLLVAGLGTLVNGPIPQLQVEWGTAVGAGFGFGGVTAALIVLGLKARRSKTLIGADAMLGWLAVAHTTLRPDGQVLVRGELWDARLVTNDSFVPAGERVKVLRADGHLLEVTALPLVDNS